MPTIAPFTVEGEAKKLNKMYRQLRKVVQTSLDKLKSPDTEVTAAMLTSLVNTMKTLPSVLAELDKLDKRRRAAESHAKEWEQIQQSLPAPAPGKSPVPAVDPYEEKPVEGIQLPFPALKTAVVNKGVQHE
jgi:hypothetical protein